MGARLTSTDHDRIVEQAHLLILRRRTSEARALVDQLGQMSPGDADVERLRAELEHIEHGARQKSLARRDWRWRLGLSTGWNRAVGIVIGILVMAYGAWNAGSSAQVASRRGLMASVTSRVRTGSRYHRRTRLWTRPVYYDIVYGVGLIVLGGAHLALIRWASRGAADWEELDTPDPKPSTTGY